MRSQHIPLSLTIQLNKHTPPHIRQAARIAARPRSPARHFAARAGITSARPWPRRPHRICMSNKCTPRLKSLARHARTAARTRNPARHSAAHAGITWAARRPRHIPRHKPRARHARIAARPRSPAKRSAARAVTISPRWWRQRRRRRCLMRIPRRHRWRRNLNRLPSRPRRPRVVPTAAWR